MKILVVDDDLQLTRLVKTMFEQLGEQAIDCAGGGREGLQRLGEDDYGLVLLDLNMPALNGVDFVVEMGHKKPGIPCIFITAAVDEMAEAAMNVARQTGVNMLGTLHKPFTLEQLETMLQQAQAA